MESQQFILGPQVQACEKAIAEYSGCGYGVGVSSGTDALLICLMAEGIGPGNEVITTPYTFFATAGSIARVGAKPVFVDIDPASYNLDAAQLESKITANTRAIIPVHLYGQMANMDAVMQVAEKHGLARFGGRLGRAFPILGPTSSTARRTFATIGFLASATGRFLSMWIIRIGRSGYLPPTKTEFSAMRLPNTRKKLQAGEKVRIVAFGDSITSGGDASEPGLIFWEHWAAALREKHPRARIETTNGATGGDTTVQGLQRLQEKVLRQKLDLVLIGFGMNDHNREGFGVPLGAFARNLRTMISRIRAATGAEIVLFSAFPPNPKWHYGSHNMEAYAEHNREGGAGRTLRLCRRVSPLDDRRRTEEAGGPPGQ